MQKDFETRKKNKYNHVWISLSHSDNSFIKRPMIAPEKKRLIIERGSKTVNQQNGILSRLLVFFWHTETKLSICGSTAIGTGIFFFSRNGRRSAPARWKRHPMTHAFSSTAPAGDLKWESKPTIKSFKTPSKRMELFRGASGREVVTLPRH